MSDTSDNLFLLRPLTVWSVPDPARGRAAVHVAGELDLSTAHLLTAELDRLPRDVFSSLDVHLKHVQFCDCAGLSALLGSRRIVASLRGRVLVHDPCESLRIILGILELTLHLEPGTAETAETAPHHTVGPLLTLLPEREGHS